MNEPNNKIPGLATRQSAIRLLDAVCRRGETLDQAMPAATGKLSNPSDKALAHNIAANVLRWMAALDAMIDSATRNRLADDAKPRMALRIALAQVLILDTPQHAAISTALPLVHGGPRRLVHGVFSTVMRGVESGALKLPEFPEIPGETLDRWTNNWGEDVANAASQAWAKPAPLDLSFQSDDIGALEGTKLAPKHLRMLPALPVTGLAGFDEGQFWVQDLAASIPVRLLGEGEGRRVLDLCAAPGGKTLALAAAGWQVTALDVSERRLERLRENLARTGLAAQIVIADALEWEPSHKFDAIMLDAPCTATGTCRRHPDVLHRISAREIAEMVPLQTALLARAANWLVPGGRLVYAVCSLEPAEGEDIAATCPLTPLAIRAEHLPAGLAPTPQGYLRTHPGQLPEAGGLDGFFISCWEAL